jgi:CBS domain-containing protein
VANNRIERLQENFIYLSQIIDLPIVDPGLNKKWGKAGDLVAGVKETYPNIVGLIINKRGEKQRLFVSWENVKQIVLGKAIYVDKISDSIIEIPNLENQLLLKKSLWDRQIVDISGSKVVRVNDLHLLRENSHMWLIHVDIGFMGILRRLGLQRAMAVFLRLIFSYELKDKLIAWKYVQPIADVSLSKSLQLKVQHAKLSELLPADLADILAELGVDERKIIYDTLDNHTAAKTLQELPLRIRIQIAESLQPTRLATILSVMPMDEVVDLVAKLPKKIITALYRLLPQDEVGQIKDLLRHSQKDAGSIMNTEFMTIGSDATVDQALEKIKIEANSIESYHYVYTTDSNQNLVGVVTLRQLLTSEPNLSIAQLMRTKIIKARVNTDVKIVAQYFSKYDFDLIPVVDKHNKMQGVITMKDAFETVFNEIRDNAD